MYDIKEAAALTELSPHTIKKRCEEYEEIGFKKSGRWFLTDDDIAFIKARKGKRGKPPIKVGRPTKENVLNKNA